MLKFVEQTDATVPRGLSVLAVLDNLSAHSIPEIKKWLAHRDQRRWHLHLHSHLELMAQPEPP